MSKTVIDGTCFRCKGTGSEKAMSIKQYNFIKELFMALVKMNIIVKENNEWHEMVNTMNQHKDGITLRSSKWASDKIEEYKARKNRVLKPKRPVYPVEFEQWDEPQWVTEEWKAGEDAEADIY
ncbi:MAG: hypothetical protein EBU08_10550 [Micrococcales bacterium]|jgi:hypothetical protein|nr:hypothetical protein [Micrococcales bacterium]